MTDTELKTAVSTNATSGKVLYTLTYEYEGCRLQRRLAALGDGTVYTDGELTFEYALALCIDVSRELGLLRPDVCAPHQTHKPRTPQSC